MTSFYKIFIFFVFLANVVFCSTKLPEPYASIRLLPANPFSQWYWNAKQINYIFSTNDIRTVIEIGSWMGGGSTRHFGDLVKNKNGKVYAVDTFLGSSEHQPGQPYYYDEVRYLYQIFLSNMVHFDLADTVIPVRMKSTEAAQSLNVKPDLIYIDGEHSTEDVYEDLTVWYPFVKDHGIMCGDDWSFESVRIAVNRFALENGLTIDASENFWRLTNLK